MPRPEAHGLLTPQGQMVLKGQPDPSDLYVVPELGNLSEDFIADVDSFVHRKVFPSLSVRQQKGKYPRYVRGHKFRNRMTKRADGAKSPIMGTEVVYEDMACEVYSLAGMVGPQERANALAHDLDQMVAEDLALAALLHREVTWFSTYFQPGVWTTQVEGDDDSSDPLVDLSWIDDDADPLAQIDAAKLTQLRLVGGMYKPNIAVMGARLWNRFKQHPKVRILISGGATTSMPALVTLQQAAALLGVKELLIAEAIQTTSHDKDDQGASDTFDLIGDDDALLMVYKADRPGLRRVSGGYTWEWSGYTGAGEAGTRVSRWYEQATRCDYYEIEQAYDMDAVAPDVGIFMHNMLDSD